MHIAGLAVDHKGNVYVTDSADDAVYEILAVNGSIPPSPTINQLGSGFSNLEGVAVGAEGNVFVADYDNNAVKEIVAVNGSIPASPTIVQLATGLHFPAGAAVDHNGNVVIADTGNSRVLEVMTAVSKFGSVNVGSASPAILLNFTFDTAGTLGSNTVLTQGAIGLDFADAGTGTCAANTAYVAPQTCTVDVTFTPMFSGTRNGAVELNDSNGHVMATAYLQGSGIGPQLSFSPGTQTTLGSSFNFGDGVAVDGSGNAYVVDVINNLGNVQEIMAANGRIPANPTIKTLVGGLDCPRGPALDAAGDVYFVDVCYHTLNEIPAANGSIPPSPTVRTLTSQFVSPAGVAVDGSGNVYVLDASNNSVSEVFAVNGSIPASPTITTLASGFKELAGIAVDGNGNVYVSDDTSREVFEIHAIDGSIPASPLITSLGSGFVIPRGIAVDVVGNVYVAEYFYNTVYKILAVNGSIPASPTIQTLGAGLAYANGVAVDASGNVFVADYGDARVQRLDYADPPSLTFASTPVGTASADSPQTVTLTNNGNASLSFPIPASGNNPSIGAYFGLSNSGPNDCPLVDSGSSAAGELAAGASCELPINFTPTAIGTASSSLVLTDNDLNATAPSYATQTISLNGSATIGTPIITWPTPAAVYYGTPLSATQLNATANVPGTFIYTPAAGTVPGQGIDTLSVTFTPNDSTDYATITQTVQLTVNPAVPATMISPTPGSTLTSASTTFNWTAGSGVSGYFLWVGTTPGSHNLVNIGKLTTTSATLTLPTSGATIYVRLFSVVNGVPSLYNDYTYTQYTVAAATMTSPANSSALTSASTTFNWTAGSGVSGYFLWIGTTPGSHNLANISDPTTSKTLTLPTSGAIIYVRLFSVVNGVPSLYNDYTYTEYTVAAATMTSPANSSALTSASTTFNWTAGSGVSGYFLWVGTTPGSHNLANIGKLTTTSVSLNLPTSGAAIYVRLFSVVNGTPSLYNDYTYTEYTVAAATMTSPANSSALTSASTTFNWTAGSGVSGYFLWVGTTPGSHNLANIGKLTTTSVSLNLPTSGAAIYVRLFSVVNGTPSLYNDYTYTEFH